MIFPIITATLVGIITLLSWLLVKMLAVLVGALLLYFCPIIGLLFAAGACVFYYRKRLIRKVVASRRIR